MRKETAQEEEEGRGSMEGRKWGEDRGARAWPQHPRHNRCPGRRLCLMGPSSSFSWHEDDENKGHLGAWGDRAAVQGCHGVAGGDAPVEKVSLLLRTALCSCRAQKCQRQSSQLQARIRAASFQMPGWLPLRDGDGTCSSPWFAGAGLHSAS